MKVLIWIICLFAASAINVLISKSTGQLGAIPVFLLYAAAFGIAAALCRAWSVHKMKKETSTNQEELFEKLQEVKKQEKED